MSHLISGAFVQAPQLLDVPQKNIILPGYKNILKTCERRSSCEEWKQQAVISRLCKKLTDMQFQKLYKKNAILIEKRCQKLKKKLKAQLPNNEKVIRRIFDEDSETDKSSLRDLVVKMPDRVELGKKKNLLFHRQAQSIERQKKDYRKWMNSSKNYQLNSPNFKKMAFLFERIDGGSSTSRKVQSPEGIQHIKRCTYTGKYMRIKTNPS